MKTYCLINAEIYTGIMTIKNGAVIVKNGFIDDVVSHERFNKKIIPKDAEIIDLNGLILSPGFIDTHIHGIKGFGTENGSVDDILGMSEALTEYGVTSFCPTLYPDSEENFIAAIRSVVSAMGKEAGAKINGMHLEGPFISRDQKGVQKTEYMRDVDLELMKKFDKIAQGNISIMTVAPELKNMRDLALYCTKQGIVLSAGHTNATYENMLEGMQAGILHSTHFFNAMRKLHHRDPGCVGAILIHPEISCEVIADGFHVHPELVKHLLKEKPADKVVLVTDSLRPTCQCAKSLYANNEEVYLDENNVFRRVTDDVIAGSSLTMLKGVNNLFTWGTSLENTLKMAAPNPAKVLGIDRKKGILLPGSDADITVFDHNFDVKLTMVEGDIKYNKL
ncbi:MAG: N-acetylglucosamine-6-phosphate deacetylase [Spirochaetales bacterium]|nr:N-acetylglucosamine-6-phosphate deacetylase [Spirochaetales bacterium]